MANVVIPVVTVNNIFPFDATQDKKISFNVNAQFTMNEIKIEENINNVWEQVYHNTSNTYNPWQIIPQNTLQNGKKYRCAFKVSSESMQTNYSQYEYFSCYTTPNVTLNIADGDTITSGAYTFTLTYSQDEGELLNYVQFNLYRGAQKIAFSEGLYPTEKEQPFTVSYTFNGLLETQVGEINEPYKLEYEYHTVDGYSSYNYLYFNVKYDLPSLQSKLSIEQYGKKGFLDITSNIISLDGQSNPTSPIYINDSTNKKILDCISCNPLLSPYGHGVIWNEGFIVNNKMLLRVKFIPSTINNNILQLRSYNNTTIFNVKFIRNGSTDFVVLENNNGAYIKSNTVSTLNGINMCYLWIKYDGTNWEIKLNELTNTSMTFIWNDSNDNVQYNTTTNIAYLTESYETNTNYNDPTPSLLKFPTDGLSYISIGNGIYDRLNITSNTDLIYSTTIEDFNEYTIFDCNFDDNINGGNMDSMLERIYSIKLKRKDLFSNDWVTLYEKKVTLEEDLNIRYEDYFIPSGVEQNYAIVPTLYGNIEGTYNITSVVPKWCYTFITDGTETYRFIHSVIYDTTTQNVSIGVLNPIGSIYPTVIQNSENNYRSGSIQLSIFGYNFNGVNIDRNDVVTQTNDVIKFLTNGKTKMITDWNGNAIMFKLISSPTISYNSSYGNGITTIAFSWVEQGKYNNEEDLRRNNFIK